MAGSQGPGHGPAPGLPRPARDTQPRLATGYGDHGKGHLQAVLQRPVEPRNWGNMNAQVALIIAGLAFIAAAVAGSGDFFTIKLPKLPTGARLISAVVGITAFILGLMPAVYTPSTPATAAPVPGASTQPAISSGPRSSVSPPQPTAPTVEAVTIDHPAFGATTRACAVFSGRASLSQGDTLVLSVLTRFRE